MITKFKIFETINVKINIPQDVLNKLSNSLSIVAYKGTKRDEKKHKNYKSIRIDTIDGYYNENKQMTNDYLFKIKMSNKDQIEAKYSNRNDLGGVIENSIYVEINGEPVYHMEQDDFTIDSFILKIGTEYKKYIENKKWKIR
jgi:hypothetical protein